MKNKHISDEWNTIGGHDPMIIKNDKNDKYYMFSTDSVLSGKYTSGIQLRISDDLIHWNYKGTVLNGVPKKAFGWSKAEGLWAPEVVKVGNQYRMYYSASTFGSTTSCICLATADNLDGPWIDQGTVIKTNKVIADHNAIDPNIIKDKYNKMWLSYGSFFGGIYLLELDESTGFPHKKNDYGKCIAKRSFSVEGAIEGPFIIYNSVFEYYYLFTSYDSLIDTYNIRVSRAKKIDGPYFDIKNQSMLDVETAPNEIGTKILGSYKFENEEEWIAPGHNSIFIDTEKESAMMVHHVRYEHENLIKHIAFIRKLRWLKNGWPVPSVEYISEIEKVDNRIFKKNDFLGIWEFIVFKNDTNETISSQKIRVTEENIKGLTECSCNNFYLSTKKIYLQIYEGYNWKDKKDNIYLSGLSSMGQTILGKKVKT